MLISGTGISTIMAKIKPDYQPATTLALQWFQLSSGNWQATDRGAGADQYDVDVRLYGTEAAMLAFVTQIEANRTAGSNVITLSGFNAQEHIFGADVDYSGSINATAFMDKRGQKTWRGFEQPLRLSCLSPSFVGGSGSLPLLNLLAVGYEGDSERTIKKYDSYARAFTYQEHSADVGTFSGVFTFSDEEMIQLRRLVAVSRGTTISVPGISGVTRPWGWRASSYPVSVKIIGFEDMGMFSINGSRARWVAKLTFGEVI